MPVRSVQGQFCGVRPDPETQTSLEHQLLDLRHGEYLDADPGNWLTWYGQACTAAPGMPAASTAAT